MEHRKLEELVGQVSRVTDLMELLESVETAKADEYSKNFEDGEVIEFKEVTIVTPACAPKPQPPPNTHSPSPNLHPGSSLRPELGVAIPLIGCLPRALPTQLSWI